MAEAAKVDYGLDSPVTVKNIFGRATWAFAIGLGIFIMNRAEYPGPALSMFLALALAGAVLAAIGWGMIWSSRTAKLALRDRLLDSLALKGDEKVLDVGCGRGLLAIGAAKRLKSGRVTGIDTWNPHVLSGNSPDAARENAKLEGVGEKIRFESGDPRKLTFSEGSFDVVVSSMALRILGDGPDRERALREMLRVLKPGGRLLVFDVLHTGSYAEVLRASGAQDVTLSEKSFLWCLPAQSVTARK